MPKLLIAALLALPCAAADLWHVSAVAYGGAMAADAASSWNKYELNPILQDRTGRFTGRGVAIKAAITGVVLIGEWMVLRRKPSLKKAVTVVNFGVAVPVAGVAVYNWSTR